MSWKPIECAEQLEDELLAYDQALADLADEGHQITPIMQICALGAMTERIRSQDKHTHDLTQWWANLSRVEDPEEKLLGQLSAIGPQFEFQFLRIKVNELPALLDFKDVNR